MICIARLNVLEHLRLLHRAGVGEHAGIARGLCVLAGLSDRHAALYLPRGLILRQEIQAEALTRNLEGFSRFIFAIAARATLPLDYTKLASQAAISRASAIRFVEILEDTFLVFRVEPFAKQNVRRIVQHPRFYFFDNGVLNALLGSMYSFQ